MRDFLAISIAAIIGANLRYFLSRLAAREFGLIFPYGTLIINILGSFIVGFFVIWTSERVLIDPRWRLLVVVGFCGSFTTFSSYAFESMSYFEQGQWGLMAANILGNNVLCLGGALAGMAMAQDSLIVTAKPTLQTARLVLRPYREADIPELLPLIGTKEVAATTLRIAHPYTEQDAREFLALTERSPRSSGWRLRCAVMGNR